MIHLYDRATMAQVTALDPTLRILLAERIETLGEELIDWTEYLVVEPGDTEDDIVRCIGLSPLIDAIDGFRWPDPAFEPGWDWLADHGGWFELLFTFGSTFAYVIFVQDADGGPAGLREMCAEYTSRNSSREAR